MPPELLVLLAASMVALQIVAVIARKEHRTEAPYLLLLVADLVVLGWVHATARPASMIAFVAESAAAVLTLGPRFLDSLERGALERDRIRRAARIALLRELIAPGRSTALRRRRLDHLARARAGDVPSVIRELKAELDATREAEHALALREELATIFFFDQRFAEGIDEVEQHLSVEDVAERPVLAAYLLRAYGETGRLDEMARVMELIEGSPLGRDLAGAGLLAQARMTFLAFTGRRAHVEALLAGALGRRLPERAHALLLEAALRRSEGTLSEPPVVLSDDVRALTERVFDRAARPVQAQPVMRRAPVTLVLVGVNVIAFAAQWAFGAVEDAGTLVHAGALFRPAVLAGQWWRLFTPMFLHGGPLHLGVNMYGLYILGRFTEDVFGPERFLCVYLASGVAGGVASTLVGQPALSVGASGAIMGLLGALIVVLVLRRGHWPEAWRRTLLVNLVLLCAIQIYIGFQIPMIDNAAHVGGVVGGAMATLLFAPGALLGDGQRARAFIRALAAALCCASVAAGVLALATPVDKTLAILPTREVVVGGVQLRVPAHFTVDEPHARLEDSYLQLTLVVRKGGDQVRLESPDAEDPRYHPLLDQIAKSAHPVPGI